MREIIKVILFIGIYSVTLNINKDNNFIKIDNVEKEKDSIKMYYPLTF